MVNIYTVVCMVLHHTRPHKSTPTYLQMKWNSLSTIEVDNTVKNLGGTIPNSHKLFSLMIDVDYNMHAAHGDLSLKQVQTSSTGYDNQRYTSMLQIQNALLRMTAATH